MQPPIGSAKLSGGRSSIGWLITVIALSVLLVGAAAFAIWSFMSRQEYKNHSDKLSAEAVAKAEEAQKTKLEAEFVEREKAPYTTYTSPATAGSLSITYPKTWSAHVAEDAATSTDVNGYFHPGFVPKLDIRDFAFALRAEVLDQPYSQSLNSYESSIKAGSIQVAPISLPKVPNVVGVRMTGTISLSNNKASGVMVLLPLRDKTLKVWTESISAFGMDFDTIIIPNLSFVP